jgi:hypothetical protein
MNFRTTYILFGLLGAALLGLVVAVWLSPVRPPDTSYVFPSAHEEGNKVEAKDIDTVEIDRSRPREEELVFSRTGRDSWKMTEPASYRINSPEVESLVNQVLNARRLKDAEVDRNLQRWGLEPPAATITLKGKGRTFQLLLGKEYPNQVYVLSSDDRKDPMIVLRSEIEDVFKPVSDFRSRDLLASRSTDITSINLRQGSGEPRILEQREGLWWFVKPPYGPADYEGAVGPDAAKGPTGVRALLDALSDIRVDAKLPPPEDLNPLKKDKKEDKKKEKPDSGFVEDNAKDLKKYGLESDKTAEMVITVKRNEEVPAKGDEKPTTKAMPVTLLIGKPVDAKKEQYFARLDNEKSVVKVSARPLGTLRKFIANPEELRDHELVHQKPDVLRIKYRSGEEVFLMKTPSTGPHAAFNQGVWKLYRGKDRTGLVTDQKSVEHFINSLMNKRLVKDYPTGQTDKALGLDSPGVVLSLWTNGIKKPEKKKEEKKADKTTAKDKKDKKDEKKKDEKEEGDRPELRSETPDEVLEFGATDSDKRVAVRRKLGKDLKETLDVKVLGSVLELVQADPLSYLEKRLPPLVPATVVFDNITKITLDLDGKTTEVRRKDPKDPNSPWVFEKPADLKGRRAGRNLVADLFFNSVNGLRNQGWKALDAKPEELAKWGLKPPLSHVTITFREGDKTQEKSLLLGKETDDKKAVYAKQGDQKAVFLVAKEDIERFNGSLLDMAVFDFQPSSVKTVKLSGWPRLGQPTVLELERKSATSWEAKKPAGVKVNATRAEQLIEALKDLKAEKFLDVKGGAKPAHGLDVKKGALEIEITLDNKDKEKLTLTIGAADGSNFYATSNKQPGTVFLIHKGVDSIFEKVKEKPEFLTVQ